MKTTVISSMLMWMFNVTLNVNVNGTFKVNVNMNVTFKVNVNIMLLLR